MLKKIESTLFFVSRRKSLVSVQIVREVVDRLGKFDDLFCVRCCVRFWVLIANRLVCFLGLKLRLYIFLECLESLSFFKYIYRSRYKGRSMRYVRLGFRFLVSCQGRYYVQFCFLVGGWLGFGFFWVGGLSFGFGETSSQWVFFCWFLIVQLLEGISLFFFFLQSVRED